MPLIDPRLCVPIVCNRYRRAAVTARTSRESTRSRRRNLLHHVGLIWTHPVARRAQEHNIRSRTLESADELKSNQKTAGVHDTVPERAERAIEIPNPERDRTPSQRPGWRNSQPSVPFVDRAARRALRDAMIRRGDLVHRGTDHGLIPLESRSGRWYHDPRGTNRPIGYGAPGGSRGRSRSLGGAASEFMKESEEAFNIQ